MSQSESFLKDNRKRYHSPELYKKSACDQLMCMYEITFYDNSSCVVVMTYKQRRCMPRTNAWKTIKSVGGLGHCTLINS